MLGLEDYASSDEEPRKTSGRKTGYHDGLQSKQASTTRTADTTVHLKPSGSATKKAEDDSKPTAGEERARAHVDVRPHLPVKSLEEPSLRPQAGPSAPASSIQLSESLTYDEQRQVIHQLTLPPLPHVDIPPSPPSSPRPSVVARIKQFLNLKQQGVHFNERLASSTALRNPTLFQSQLEFAGMSEDDQYATTLPKGLKPVPENGFPYWAYGPELNKSQERLARKREREKGGKVEFVNGKSSAALSTSDRDPKRQRHQ